MTKVNRKPSKRNRYDIQELQKREMREARERAERMVKAEGTITFVDVLRRRPVSLLLRKNFQPCSLHRAGYPPAPTLGWDGKPQSTNTNQYKDKRDGLLVALYNECFDCRELTQTAIRVAIHKEVSGKPWTYSPPRSLEYRLFTLRTIFPHTPRHEQMGRWVYDNHTQECCERAAYEGWFKQAGMVPPRMRKKM